MSEDFNVNNNASQTLIITRFTITQFNKIALLPDNAIFTHINLQHNGIPIEFQSPFARYQIGVQILAFGRNLENGSKKAPVIDNHTYLLLEQVDFNHSIPIEKPLSHNNLILSDDRGIPYSLLVNYGEVMDITLADLKDKKYYYRVFREIGVFVV